MIFLLAAVVEEANTAFRLNAGLFELLDRNWEVESKEKTDKRVVFEAAQPAEKAYPLSTVVAVIAAGTNRVFLASMIIVTIFLQFAFHTLCSPSEGLRATRDIRSSSLLSNGLHRYGNRHLSERRWS